MMYLAPLLVPPPPPPLLLLLPLARYLEQRLPGGW
jgi:hypothetical protein